MILLRASCTYPPIKRIQTVDSGENRRFFRVLQSLTVRTSFDANVRMKPKAVVYVPPAPVRQPPPRLLKDVAAVLDDVLYSRPPFSIGVSQRLTIPEELVDKFPLIDSLFDSRAGQKGRRRQIEHDTTDSASDEEVVIEEKEFYYENVDVRDDLKLEAEALLSALTKSQVIHLKCCSTAEIRHIPSSL